MNVVIAGSSGLVGHALVEALHARGDGVKRLVRREARTTEEISWDPATRRLHPAALDDCDAIVNLAGENIAGGRWTAQRRAGILRSRIDSTVTLVDTLRGGRSKPRVLINASAVGWYGSRGEEEVTEDSAAGEGFLADVCRAWEAEAERATAVGVRVARLRLGLVLAPDGGAFARMRPLFRAGLGGRLGSGRQWIGWIHRADVIGVIVRALGDSRYVGALNVTGPAPARNSEFVREFGRVVHRPAIVAAPRWALRLAFGRMADETLLASTRVRPARLAELGYPYRFPDLPGALAEVERARTRGAGPDLRRRT